MPKETNPNVAPNPRVGMLAIVRKRRGVISEVREFDGADGRLHLVHVDYKDDQRPMSEKIIWELEPYRHLLSPGHLPSSNSSPMPGEDFDALVRAARWTAITPYLQPDDHNNTERLPFTSPFHGAVQVDDYQLVPLLKALRMPRVNLLLADDVGLGKTIEAGLILSELLIRRRVNRVLILTPASLRVQWRDEMWSKFSLPFDVIDRDSTIQLKRSLGIDANPWRYCSRIIASYHYLRQPDVLEQFMSTSRIDEGSAQLPWDLLIVDEVHNLMPVPFGDDSQLCQMLRQIAPRFEHRLFLTATPHNGHTRSFTGLLELLDPVRFSRTDELRPAEKERIKQVVIRRLKREINERSDSPRFCTRKPPQALFLEFHSQEQELMKAFERFRVKVRSIIGSTSRKRRHAGSFAISILGKRMLSGPVTFLESWRRCKLGLSEEETAEDKDLVLAGQSVEEDTDDDRDYQQRESTAAVVIGSWMRAFAAEIVNEINDIDTAAEKLGINYQQKVTDQDPAYDARFSALTQLIEKLVRPEDKWGDDERLVVFTEYKTTLDYLLRRLRQQYPGEEERILCLFGGMDSQQREDIKEAFNDPASPVRILIATDAASEGLNLQSTARFLLHYDCPWNPSRLEQRNGRLDRHGQARDVYVHHFASEQDADLKFIAYLIGKIDQIREDLGAVGEIFDEATHRRLIEAEDMDTVQSALEQQLEKMRQSMKTQTLMDTSEEWPSQENQLYEKLKELTKELDLDPLACRDTLETAMSMDYGRPQLTDSDELERFEFIAPDLPGWKDTIDETIRKQSRSGLLGPIPKLSFSPKPFLKTIGPRTVFLPRPDTLMLHLGHPLMQKANGALTRRRFPGEGAVSRWSVRYDEIPQGTEALILLHLEELGINELRETFHHYIRTIRFPVYNGELSEPLSHIPAAELRRAHPCFSDSHIKFARELLSDLEPELQDYIKEQRGSLTQKLKEQLKIDGIKARDEEEQRYQSRHGEVSSLIAENTMAKLEKDINRLKEESQQLRLFEEQYSMDQRERAIKVKEEELQRRHQHYEEVRAQLAKERERILRFLLPRRYSLQGEAQVFPVAVEIRLPLPEGGAS